MRLTTQKKGHTTTTALKTLKKSKTPMNAFEKSPYESLTHLTPMAVELFTYSPKFNQSILYGRNIPTLPTLLYTGDG